MPVILDARANGAGSLGDTAREMGIRVEYGKAIAKVKGGKRVTGVATLDLGGALTGPTLWPLAVNNRWKWLRIGFH